MILYGITEKECLMFPSSCFFLQNDKESVTKPYINVSLMNSKYQKKTIT